MPGPKDTGGVLKIGPDDNLYLTVGHLDGSFNNSKYETKTQNYPKITQKLMEEQAYWLHRRMVNL